MVNGVSMMITGILPQLAQEFPNVPTTLIEWLVTSANLSALVTLLLNPWFSRKFGIKPVVIAGLLISMIAGTLPFVIYQFVPLMISRLFLGLGIGLFSPHPIGLIAHLYTGELRAKLLGYQVGLGVLGSALFLALAGLTFGRLYDKCRRYTLVIGYAGAALAIGLLLVAQQTFTAVFAAVFFSFIYSYTGPYLVFISQQNLSPHLIDTMSSWFTIATIISAFFAPLLWNTLDKIGPGHITDNTMLWTALSLAVLALFVFKHAITVTKIARLDQHNN